MSGLEHGTLLPDNTKSHSNKGTSSFASRVKRIPSQTSQSCDTLYMMPSSTTHHSSSSNRICSASMPRTVTVYPSKRTQPHPGPSQYSTHHSWTSSSPSHCQPRHLPKNYAFLSSSTRLPQDSTPSNVGPGSYDLRRNTLSPRHSGPQPQLSSSFASQTSRLAKARRETVPAPNFYNPHSPPHPPSGKQQRKRISTSSKGPLLSASIAQQGCESLLYTHRGVLVRATDVTIDDVIVSESVRPTTSKRNNNDHHQHQKRSDNHTSTTPITSATIAGAKDHCDTTTTTTMTVLISEKKGIDETNHNDSDEDLHAKNTNSVSTSSQVPVDDVVEDNHNHEVKDAHQTDPIKEEQHVKNVTSNNNNNNDNNNNGSHGSDSNTSVAGDDVKIQDSFSHQENDQEEEMEEEDILVVEVPISLQIARQQRQFILSTLHTPPHIGPATYNLTEQWGSRPGTAHQSAVFKSNTYGSELSAHLHHVERESIPGPGQYNLSQHIGKNSRYSGQQCRQIRSATQRGAYTLPTTTTNKNNSNSNNHDSRPYTAPAGRIYRGRPQLQGFQGPSTANDNSGGHDAHNRINSNKQHTPHTTQTIRRKKSSYDRSKILVGRSAKPPLLRELLHGSTFEQDHPSVIVSTANGNTNKHNSPYVHTMTVVRTRSYDSRRNHPLSWSSPSRLDI